MSSDIVLQNVFGQNVVARGQVRGLNGVGRFVRRNIPFTPPTPPTPTVNYSYLAIQKGTGNFRYVIYNTIANNWESISIDSGYDSTFTYISAGFTGNKFWTRFTKTISSIPTTFFQFLDTNGIVVQSFNAPTSANGLTLQFNSSNVILYIAYALSTTSLGVIRYEPYTNTFLQRTLNVSSMTNLSTIVYYDMILIGYRSQELPSFIINYTFWTISQTDIPSPSITLINQSISYYTAANERGSTTAAISTDGLVYGWNTDGQVQSSVLSAANLTYGAFTNLGGQYSESITSGTFIKGFRPLRHLRANYYEYYIFDYDNIAVGQISVNPVQRIVGNTSFTSLFGRTSAYTSGQLSIPSKNAAVTETNSSSYINGITLPNVITNGNYTDISGSVVGGRTFYLSRIAYNTYYQEPTFGYITGNSDNPVVTILYMSNGSAWIQASGTIASGRSAMTVSNTTSTYSINKFFTVETIIPILEPNDATFDLPTTTNSVNERSWWALHQNINLKYIQLANATINQGTLGMIIRPKNSLQIVRQIQFRAGNDSLNRDPLTFTLEGSNDGGTNYTIIVANAATNISGNPASRYFLYYSSVFANTSSYTQYRLTFPTIRSGPNMQIQKVQFLAAAPGGYLMDGSVNASVTLQRGVTYHFKINAPDDIFWIQTVPAPYSAANVYNTGVTNNGCKSSILTFAVPEGSPSTLYYVSQTDPTKTGTINIVNSGASTGNISGTWWASQNYNATNNSWAEIWFSIENTTQWGSSGITLLQDLRPTTATPNTFYSYTMGIGGQNYLFGKMNYLSNSVGVISSATITARIQEYILNLNLFNTFSTVSFPKLYSHITPTTAYSLPAASTGVITHSNGNSLFTHNSITFNVTAYNNITINRFGSILASVGSQTFTIFSRIGGVQHIPGSAPVIDAANGWSQLIQTTGAPNPTSFSNAIFLIPVVFGISISPGQTYGFCLHSSAGFNFQDNTVGSTQQFFENNDFRITVGDNAGYSSGTGPSMPFTVSNTPFSLAGYIQAVRTATSYSISQLSTVSFSPIYRIGNLYSIFRPDLPAIRRIEYNTPSLFISSYSGIYVYSQNKDYGVLIETDQYNVYVRIIRASGEGDILVPIRTNMIMLPSTFGSGAIINTFQGYVCVDINYQALQRNYVFIRLSDGVIVASGTDPTNTVSFNVTGRKLMRLNSNNTITMFRNEVLETYSTFTFTSIVRMRFDKTLDDVLFAYSTNRALALTDAGYNVVTFPVALTNVNAIIVANDYLTLIQTTPFRIYVIGPTAILYTYSLAQNVTIIRRLNTDTTITVHATYTTGSGPTYTFRMTDAFGDGWNGNTMEIRQGASVIATIGSTFISGSGPVDVTVGLTSGLAYSLFWTPSGSFPEEVGVQILNPSGTSIYQMPFNSQSLRGTTLTTFTAVGSGSTTTLNQLVTFDTVTNQFYTNTATSDAISNIVSNFIYQP